MRIEDTTILITDDSILARKQLKDIISTLGTPVFVEATSVKKQLSPSFKISSARRFARVREPESKIIRYPFFLYFFRSAIRSSKLLLYALTLFT